MDEWINKKGYIHIKEYYLIMKLNKVLIICYNVEVMEILCYVKSITKDHLLCYFFYMKYPQWTNPQKQTVDQCWPRGGGEGWRVTTEGHSVSFRDDENILDLDNVDGYTTCVCTKKKHLVVHFKKSEFYVKMNYISIKTCKRRTMRYTCFWQHVRVNILTLPVKTNDPTKVFKTPVKYID